MKTRQTVTEASATKVSAQRHAVVAIAPAAPWSAEPPAGAPSPAVLPDSAELAALRAWVEGLESRAAVDRFLGDRRAPGESARGVIARLRQRVVDVALRCHRPDLAALFRSARPPRVAAKVRAVQQALATLASLQHLPVSPPLLGDELERWLAPRWVAVLKAAGIRTFADLTVRVPRRRRWWGGIPGLGALGARQIEAVFAAYPTLTQSARALVVVSTPEDVTPWERLVVPEDLDGSQGLFRAPRARCALQANDDYAAVQAWLELQESAATQRAYRKEAERLLLWAIVEQSKALSSLTLEDATAYRAFLRRPTPRVRWVGPSRPRLSQEWRPFAGALSTRSVAYAISVLGALFRWLVAQRYVVGNPFAGVKVRGAQPPALDTSRAFAQGEWGLVRTIADGLEWSYGWSPAAARRLRFLLDFSRGTGLRASELVGATLGNIEQDAEGDHWLHVVGKGAKVGKVALVPLARQALERYLMERGLPVSPTLWRTDTPLLASLEDEGGITTSRLWRVMTRFFAMTAGIVEADSPSLAEKLRRATPHWMRHTHATHALQNGAELPTVRDNLRHASVSTTSTYLHSDDVRRARQLGEAFARG